MSIDRGAVRHEQVTTAMEILVNGQFRQVIQGAVVYQTRGGPRIKIRYRYSGTRDKNLLNLLPHTTIRARPALAQPAGEWTPRPPADPGPPARTRAPTRRT